MSQRKGGEMRIDPLTGEREWWSKEDIAMEANPRCGRCSLQLPHDECLPKDAVEIVLSRRSEMFGSLPLDDGRTRRKKAE